MVGSVLPAQRYGGTGLVDLCEGVPHVLLVEVDGEGVAAPWHLDETIGMMNGRHELGERRVAQDNAIG